MSLLERWHLRAVAACLAACAVAQPLAAQWHSEAQAESHGSFLLTATAATAGALAGFAAATLLAPIGSSMCPTVPGADCRSNAGAVLVTVSATLVGATAGAVVGNRLTRGRQSVPRSLFGAGLGLLVGGAILTQLDTDADAAVVLSFAIPQGLFAALIGR